MTNTISGAGPFDADRPADRATDRANVDEMLRLAREGARERDSRPLLGGEIGLMFTGLATIALFLHGLALMGVIPLPVNMIGLIWMIYGLVGWGLSVVMSRKIGEKPGHDSIFNRVGEASWLVGGVMIAAFGIGSVVAHVVFGVPYIVFNFIVPFAYAVAAVNNGLLARLTGFGYLKYGAVSAGVLAVVTLLMVDQVEMYLVAAVGLLLSGVLTSFIEIRRERAGG